MPVKASEEEPVKETVAEQEPAAEKREAQALECEAQPEWRQELERGRQENDLEPAQEIERDWAHEQLWKAQACWEQEAEGELKRCASPLPL